MALLADGIARRYFLANIACFARSANLTSRQEHFVELAWIALCKRGACEWSIPYLLQGSASTRLVNPGGTHVDSRWQSMIGGAFCGLSKVDACTLQAPNCSKMRCGESVATASTVDGHGKPHTVHKSTVLCSYSNSANGRVVQRPLQ